MNKLKTGVMAAAGIAVGVVTLRAIRNRRKAPHEEAEEAVEETKEELETATEHATAAVEHASVAVEKTLESFREESEKAEKSTES